MKPANPSPALRTGAVFWGSPKLIRRKWAGRRGYINPMAINGEARRSALRNFLTSCRARLRPSDVGLPSVEGRRCPGLRREEVAELAGVSAHWYALFESGSSHRRFSADFVRRVADVLQLDERERATLNRLALPEVATAIESFERSVQDGAFRSFKKIRAFSRSIHAASSFEEATLAAIKTIYSIGLPDSMTVASFERSNAPPYAIAIGRQARFADERQAQALLDSSAPTRSGATVLCENAPDPRAVSDDASHPVRIKMSDGREVSGLHNPDPLGYREFNGRARQGSGLIVALFEGSTYRGILGSFWRTPRKHPDIEVDAMETVSAILALLGTGRS